MKGLCEHCGKIIEVDTSKSADLCPLCNGAIDTKSAVKMYKSKVVLCPNCGQEEIIDKSNRATVCSHCGKPFLQKNAVKQDSAVVAFVEKKIINNKKGSIAFFSVVLACLIVFCVFVSMYATTVNNNPVSLFKDSKNFDELKNWLITLDGTQKTSTGYGTNFYTTIVETSNSVAQCSYEYHTKREDLEISIMIFDIKNGSRNVVGTYNYYLSPCEALSDTYCIRGSCYTDRNTYVGDKVWSVDAGWKFSLTSSNNTQAQKDLAEKLISQMETTANSAILEASGVSMGAVCSEIEKFVPHAQSVAATYFAFFIIFFILSVGLGTFYVVFYVLYKQKCKKIANAEKVQ